VREIEEITIKREEKQKKERRKEGKKGRKSEVLGLCGNRLAVVILIIL
jgi:hypothetical protein